MRLLTVLLLILALSACATEQKLSDLPDEELNAIAFRMAMQGPPRPPACTESDCTYHRWAGEEMPDTGTIMRAEMLCREKQCEPKRSRWARQYKEVIAEIERRARAHE